MRHLAAWTVSALLPYGWLGLFVLAFSESSFFPMPPDILLLALAIMDNKASFFLAAVTTAGSLLGGIFGYIIGKKGGRPILKRLISGERMALVERYYKKYDVWAVGIAGFTPIPYKIFTLSAGIFELNFPRFVLVSLLSRGARFFLVASAIYAFGPVIREAISEYFNLFTVIFALLLIGGFYILKITARRNADVKR